MIDYLIHLPGMWIDNFCGDANEVVAARMGLTAALAVATIGTWKWSPAGRQMALEKQSTKILIRNTTGRFLGALTALLTEAALTPQEVASARTQGECQIRINEEGNSRVTFFSVTPECGRKFNAVVETLEELHELPIAEEVRNLAATARYHAVLGMMYLLRRQAGEDVESLVGPSVVLPEYSIARSKLIELTTPRSALRRLLWHVKCTYIRVRRGSRNA